MIKLQWNDGLDIRLEVWHGFLSDAIAYATWYNSKNPEHNLTVLENGRPYVYQF